MNFAARNESYRPVYIVQEFISENTLIHHTTIIAMIVILY